MRNSHRGDEQRKRATPYSVKSRQRKENQIEHGKNHPPLLVSTNTSPRLTVEKENADKNADKKGRGTKKKNLGGNGKIVLSPNRGST